MRCLALNLRERKGRPRNGKVAKALVTCAEDLEDSHMGLLSLRGDSYLRLLDESDAGELHALIERNRDHLARWLPWAEGQTAADTLGFIRRARGQLDRNDGFQAAVVRSGAIAGVIGYHGVDWSSRSTSVGYWLGERSQGAGTMTEAVRALTDHALLTWKLNRVEIRAASKNLRSRAIPGRLGFREEGTLRQAERVGDLYLDIVVYSMLAAEWDVDSPADDADL